MTFLLMPLMILFLRVKGEEYQPVLLLGKLLSGVKVVTNPPLVVFPLFVNIAEYPFILKLEVGFCSFF